MWVITIGGIAFYVNSNIEKLSEFINATEKHFNTQLKSVECLGKTIVVN